MGLRDSVIETLFGGQKDPLANIIKGAKGVATDPDALALSAPKGTLWICDFEGDVTDYDIWINTGVTDDSTWDQIYNSDTQGHPTTTGWATT